MESSINHLTAASRIIRVPKLTFAGLTAQGNKVLFNKAKLIEHQFIGSLT